MRAAFTRNDGRCITDAALVRGSVGDGVTVSGMSLTAAEREWEVFGYRTPRAP